MISGLCGSLTLSGEFWAAIAGAVVGGVISLGIQLLALRSAKNERDAARKEISEATAHRLFFKLRKISSDLDGFAATVVDAEAKGQKIVGQAWQSLMAIANLPSSIEIDPDELRIAILHRDFTLLNKVADAERIHMGALGLQKVYAERRATFAARMSAEMEGSVGHSALTKEELASVAPLIAELDSLASAIIKNAKSDADEVHQTMIEFNDAMKTITGQKFVLKFPMRQ